MLTAVLALAGPALAGPLGAAGDVYISDGFAGGLYQYDAVTGNVVGKFASRGTRTFLANAWGPDGNLYAVTSVNLNRWDVDKFDGQTGAWLGAVVPHLNDGSLSVGKGIAFGPDGDLFLGDWFRAKMHRYEAGSFALVDTYSAVPGDNLGTPNYMSFGPNGNLFVVAGGFNKVLEFETSSNSVELKGDFASYSGAQQPQDVLFTDHGTMIVSGGNAGGIAEFDAANGSFIRTLVNDPAIDPLGMRIDNQGRLLVALGGGGHPNDYGVVMYDVNTGAYLGDFFTYPNGGGGLDGSPIYISVKPVPEPAIIGLLLLGGAALIRRRGGAPRDTSGNRLARLARPAAAAVVVALFSVPALAGPTGAMGDVYVSDGDAPGVYQYDGLTGAFVPNGSQGYFAGKPPRVVNENVWGPDGNLYAVNFQRFGRWSVDKFDGNTGALLSTVVNFNDLPTNSAAKGLAFGPDGDLYVGDWFRARIERYDGTTFAPKATYASVPGENLLGTPNGMTFAPNGNLMVISGGFNKVLEFDTSANGLSLLGAFADLGLSQQPQDLTFGPNGNLFVTGGGGAFGGGQNVMEFDGTTGAYIRDFVSLPGTTTSSLVFDNHGRLLVSTGGPNGFNVDAFDAVTGTPLGKLILEGSGGLSFPYFLSVKPVPEPGAIGVAVAAAALGLRRFRRRSPTR